MKWKDVTIVQNNYHPEPVCPPSAGKPAGSFQNLIELVTTSGQAHEALKETNLLYFDESVGGIKPPESSGVEINNSSLQETAITITCLPV